MEKEEATRRSKSVLKRIENLPLSKITPCCKSTLVRLANSELDFLTHLSPSPSPSSSSLRLSCNVGYIEGIVHILDQPYITGVSRVCNSITSSCHVDIVCSFNKNPTWFIVSNRNPNCIYWDCVGRNKGLKVRIEGLVRAARCSHALKPAFVVLFFTRGLGSETRDKVVEEFGFREFEMEFFRFGFDFVDGFEGDWVDVVVGDSYRGACALVLDVNESTRVCPSVDSVVELSSSTCVDKMSKEKRKGLGLQSSLLSLIQEMEEWPSDMDDVKSVGKDGDLRDEDLVNFDTTALIAIVSGISNGGEKKVLTTPEHELRQRFKNNTKFVISQAMSELKSPILAELIITLSSKKGIACESVRSEFIELVSMCGGPNEQIRADQLVKRLKIVPDNPSARMMCLPTTRKLALKNKVTFGTGDYWGAPTLTANMGFVRAISQTGMPLFTVEHRPRALIGD